MTFDVILPEYGDFRHCSYSILPSLLLVYLMGARFLYRAFDNAPYPLNFSIQKRSFAMSWLSFKPISENFKTLGYLVRQSTFKTRKSLVCWQDFINNSIRRHKIKNYTVCSRVEPLEILKHTKNFIAIVFGQRLGTLNNYEDLRRLDITIIDAKMKLPSKRKQRKPEFALELKKLHSPPALKCNFISTILRKQSAVYSLVLKTPSKTKAQQEYVES